MNLNEIKILFNSFINMKNLITLDISSRNNCLIDCYIGNEGINELCYNLIYIPYLQILDIESILYLI